MKKFLQSLTLLAVVAVVSCVTINIYFPAEEIRGAADRIVEEVYGEKNASEQSAPANPDSSFIPLWGPSIAYAEQDINVSTPEIRAIRADMKSRFANLQPYLDAGNLGIGRDGFLQVRNTGGLSLKQRAELSRLVEAENQDRRRLYQEIAKANGFPEKTDEVQAIFADSWRSKAEPGWYLEGKNGEWQKK